MKIWLVGAVILAGCQLCAPAFCQASISGGYQRDAPLPVKQVSVKDVVAMKQAGLSDDIVIAQIRQHNDPTELSTDDLIGLKKEKVSDAVIRALIDPKGQPSVSPCSTSTPVLASVLNINPSGATQGLVRPPWAIRMIRLSLTIRGYTFSPRILRPNLRWSCLNVPRIKVRREAESSPQRGRTALPR
jgi:hypothetical protein